MVDPPRIFFFLVAWIHKDDQEMALICLATVIKDCIRKDNEKSIFFLQ